MNDDIRFSNQQWKCLIEDWLGTDDAETGAWLAYLARLPDLMRRCRQNLHYPFMPSTTSLPNLISEASSLFEKCKIDIDALRGRLRALEEDSSTFKMKNILHAHRVRTLGLSLTTGVYVGCILRSLSGKPLRLCNEMSQWSYEIFQLSETALKYRPLGSMAMMFCLSAAWMGTASRDLRRNIETLTIVYEKMCPGSSFKANPAYSLQRIERRFMLKDPWLDDGASSP